MEDKICKRLDVISEDLRDINMKIDYIIDALGDEMWRRKFTRQQ